MDETRTDDIHIGLDLDGVLIDHTAQKILLARELGVNIRPAQTNTAVLSGLMDHDKYVQLQDRLYNDPVVSLRSPLMEGASDMLSTLARQGIRFTLVSRRRKPDWAKHILEHHGLRPGFLYDDNTYFVGRPEEKNHVALRLGITHYLDDEIKVLKHLEDVPNKFLMDPHGVYAPTHWFGVVRSLPEFLKRVITA